MFPFDAIEGKVTGGGQPVTSGWHRRTGCGWQLGGRRMPQPSTRRVGTSLLAANDVAQANAPVRLLAADPGYNLFEQRFSPDQRRISFIAVNGADAGVSTVFVMPVSGGAWKAITDGTSYDDKPHRVLFQRFTFQPPNSLTLAKPIYSPQIDLFIRFGGPPAAWLPRTKPLAISHAEASAITRLVVSA
jgi:hypothetical protein